MRLRDIIRIIESDPHKSIKAFIRRFCSEKLGEGVYRDVYVLKHNPNYVVKIERNMKAADFANVTEWRHFIQNKEWEKFSKWLAICHLISINGDIMIQDRIWYKRPKHYPKKIPSLFSDRKYANFGWNKKGEFVCCDYSFIVITNFKLRTARWWGWEYVNLTQLIDNK